MPKFSIIIPVYNVAPYLRECLDSVLAQTFADWEAICVDDGSTDGSDVILDEYAEKDSRFRVVHQENAGVSVARNEALGLVRGEYVGFVDGDDAILPWHLEMVHELIERYEAPDLVRQFKSVRFDSKHAEIRPEFNSLGVQIVEGRAVFSFVMKEIVRNGLPQLNFFRAEKIKGLHFPAEVKFAEDGIFFTSTISRIERICFVQASTYCYREGRDGCATREIQYDDALRFIDALTLVFSGLRTKLPWIENEMAVAYTNFLMKIFKRFKTGQGVGGAKVRKGFLMALRRVVKTEYFDDSEIPLRRRIAFRVYLWTGLFIVYQGGAKLSGCIRGLNHFFRKYLKGGR